MWSYLDIAVVVLISLAFNATIGVDIPNTIRAQFAVAVWQGRGRSPFPIAGVFPLTPYVSLFDSYLYFCFVMWNTVCVLSQSRLLF